MYAALSICEKHKPFPEDKTFPTLERIVKTSTHWDLTDSISSNVRLFSVF